MVFELDGKAMTDRPSVHSQLAERLELPEYYGRNLDALYDVLTGIGTETELILQESSAVTEQLGRYGKALLDTLTEAAQSNPNLTVTLK